MDGPLDGMGDGDGDAFLDAAIVREFYHTVNDAFFVHDAVTGDIVDVNERMCEMYGYTRAEARELSVSDLSSGIPPYTGDAAAERMRWTAEGEPQVFDWQARDADGEAFWVEVSTRRAAVDGDEFVFATVRDITARKSNEQTLELFETLIDRSNDEVYVVDAASGDIVRVNQTVCDHLGYSRGELVGEPVTVVSEGFESLDEWTAHVDDLRGSDGFRGVSTHTRADGTTYPVEASSSYVVLGADEYVVAIARDIVARKERERTLTEEREKYSTLVEQSNDGVLIHRDGRFLFANERACEMFGYEEDELVGLSFERIVAPGDVELVRERFERRLDPDTESPPAQYDTHFVTRDGVRRVGEVNASPIRYEGERAILVTVRDVTERKEYEERLEEKTEELETLNRIVRHDIRNDMNVVLGWGELLSEHVDEKGAEYLRKILTNGEHIVELTEVARDYAGYLSAEGELELRPVPLRSVLENELELRRESFPDADLSLVGSVPDAEVQGNEMLRSVFRNLLNNAVQHNDAETPVVTVACEEDPESVAVSIADNGPGIPDDQKESIFGKGSKGVESAGSGMGLFLVQSLVDTYGGTVSVADDEPTGAVFEVRLRKAG